VAVSIISRESQQITIPGGTQQTSPVLPPVVTTITVETGVVVFTFLGTIAHDWTRDTVAFPVGPAIPTADFVNGIAAATTTSFWTPMNNAPVEGKGTEQIPVGLSGGDSAGNSVTVSGEIDVSLPGFIAPPPVGFAIDSAQVAAPASFGQPVLTLALAVFGNCAAMLRASYTAYLVTNSGGSAPPIP